MIVSDERRPQTPLLRRRSCSPRPRAVGILSSFATYFVFQALLSGDTLRSPSAIRAWFGR